MAGIHVLKGTTGVLASFLSIDGMDDFPLHREPGRFAPNGLL